MTGQTFIGLSLAAALAGAALGGCTIQRGGCPEGALVPCNCFTGRGTAQGLQECLPNRSFGPWR